MLPHLMAANYVPQICHEPETNLEDPDVSGLAERLREQQIGIAVFQKVHGPSVLQEVRKLSTYGIKTVYAVCDLVDIEMARATDATIAVTDYLKSLYPPELQQKIAVVHDGIEHPEVCKTNPRPDRGSRKNPLRAVLVTSEDLHELPVIGAPPPWLEVTIVGRYAPAGQSWQRMREARWTLAKRSNARERLNYLRFLANGRIHRVAWDAHDVYEALRQADIGIIPIDTSPGPEPGEPSPRWKVKSENRLTMKMCIGLPVIATPIPAYEPVIAHRQNGFFARSREDWIDSLDMLRDPMVRRSIGRLARESVLTRYSIGEQARRLIETLRALTPHRTG
jgi:glycosyltransferase involved in cell wall biosynthesis